ncbi:MAG: MFS transporter [Chloroflexi bacterium]|nr:MFS transporter [Chloroflexota bacterium]
MPLRLTGLWRNTDFVKLWAGQTVSNFGTLMGALQFTAVLALSASPFQMGVLLAVGAAPGLLVGLVVGVWVDRLPRRPMLIAADIGRAVSLGSIPVAFVIGVLRMEQLYAVAFLNGALRTFFDIAYRSYLPSLVGRESLVEANSKLTASESVVEATAFSIGGWIVQLISAMAAVVIDALSFLVSAFFLLKIRKTEPPPDAESNRQSTIHDLSEGLRFVWGTPLLRAVTGSAIAEGMGDGIVGALWLIYGIDELGFEPGVLGTIAAVGGISAIFGATFARRITKRFGVGRTMAVGFLLYGLSMLLIPAARGPLAIAALFLIAHQLGDGAMIIYEINEMSLRQTITPDRLLGRVNASIRFVGIGTFLIGSLLGGALAEAIGLRWALAAGAGSVIIGALWLAASPIGRLKEMPTVAAD